MSLTLPDVEAVVVRDLASWLGFVGLDSTTVDGTNPSLKTPEISALAALGIFTESPITPTQGELDQVEAEDSNLFIILMKIYTLDQILFASTMSDWSMGGRSESSSQFADRVERMKTALFDVAKRDYGFTAGVQLTGGSISIDQAAKDSDEWTSSQA
jgi:hypothetical protein